MTPEQLKYTPQQIAALERMNHVFMPGLKSAERRCSARLVQSITTAGRLADALAASARGPVALAALLEEIQTRRPLAVGATMRELFARGRLDGFRIRRSN